MNDDLALVHAIALGRELGDMPVIQRNSQIDEADLRSLALTTLKRENVGVQREGPRFTVRSEYLEAFYAGLFEHAPNLQVVEHEVPPNPTLAMIERDKARIVKDLGRMEYEESLYRKEVARRLAQRAQLRGTHRQISLL